MRKNQRENTKKVDEIRDALLAGKFVKKPQEIGGVLFTVLVAMERTGCAADDHKAAEEMASYIYYGGMTL